MAAVNGYQGNTPADPPASNGSKQAAAPTKTVDSQSVLKRYFSFPRSCTNISLDPFANSM